MRQRNPKLLGITWAIIVLVFVTSMFTASFFLTAYIYKITNLKPSILLVQIVNSLLGLLFTGLLIGSVSHVARLKGWAPEMNVFGPIIEAMQKIAKGDFSVQLDNTFRANEPVSVLVKSMNDMVLELNEMENMRQEFISNVSHEIQSPLTSIRGFAQALENDLLSLEERHHYLAIIENESDRLSRITDNLLKLASLESKQLKFEPKPYRLDKQIRSLILACEPQWTHKGIDMDVSLEEAEITADQDLLSQVWINLIHNSIKFTPQSGRVRVSLCRHDGQIHFSISDTGIGISEEDQAHVFERFFKADKSRTRSNGGSGLGLSIAKKIVEMHQGTIEVESRLGAGTTFTVSMSVG
jgi:two-component system, OmpR family, phosphate regulon sensor histidine kinase PhoR